MKNELREEISVLTKKFHQVGANHFKPSESARVVIIINPAMGVRQKYYFDYAAYLAQQGFDVFTYDYQGIGQSKTGNLWNLDATIIDWAQNDFEAMISHVKQTFPDYAIGVIGHSIGAQIIGMTPQSAKFNAIMLISAQIPSWKLYERMKKRLWLFWHIILPTSTRVVGFFPAAKLGLFEDIPKAAALQWMRWAKSENYLFEEFPDLEKSFTALTQPAKVYSFSDDALAPRKAVDALLGYYKNLKIDHEHFNPEELAMGKIGHTGFFRNKLKNTLWKQSAEWLKLHTRKHSFAVL